MNPPADFRCVAVETSTEVCSIAACAGGVVARRAEREGPDRSRLIYRRIREVLDELELELSALDCIAFGCGPGSFTGLRVGAAVAQALGFGAALPVCRISSLAVLARGGARRSGVEAVAPCLDARMGEIYAAAYRQTAQGLQLMLPERVCAPEALELPGDTLFLPVGPGWLAYPQLAERLAPRLLDADPAGFPDAVDLLGLAGAAFAAGEVVGPAEALPNYLRDRVTG